MTLPLKLRLGLLVGTHYRCRCGAVVRVKFSVEHEDFHRALEEFFRPPSANEIAAAIEAGCRT